jgi:signal transduction histidine kinase
VAAQSHEPTLAARSFGDGGTFAAPAGQPAAPAREPAATCAEADRSGEMSRILGNLPINAIRRIPEEEPPRVSDTGRRGSHARTPPAGAGLGLAIVRGVVVAHAGRAEVRNVQGGGRFPVTLATA